MTVGGGREKKSFDLLRIFFILFLSFCCFCRFDQAQRMGSIESTLSCIKRDGT